MAFSLIHIWFAHFERVSDKAFSAVQGLVVQRIVSLTSSIRDQLVFYDFITKHTEFFAEKMSEAFALQKRLTFFSTKISAYSRY